MAENIHFCFYAFPYVRMSTLVAGTYKIKTQTRQTRRFIISSWY